MAPWPRVASGEQESKKRSGACSLGSQGSAIVARLKRGEAARFLLKPRDVGSRTGSERSAPDVLERAKSRRRFAPIAKAVAWGCLGLFVGYLGGMNAFLQTRWFRSLINFSPEQLLVEYRRAYSILPGKIHADGLSIRGSDGSVEW